MREKIKIYLSGFQSIFGDPEDSVFVGLFSNDVFDLLEIIVDADYCDVRVIPVDTEEIPFIISSILGKKHVFCITTGATFRSPDISEMGTVKLGVLPLFSTEYSFRKLEKSLEIIFDTDYVRQYEKSKFILSELEDADSIVLESPIGTSAQFDLLYPNRIYFFNQSGMIDWGRQSVLPNGEVSLLTNGHGEYLAQSKFSFNGEILLDGMPVLHYGNCPCSISRHCTSFQCSIHKEELHNASQIARSREKQKSIFDNLNDLETHPIIIKIENGIINEIQVVNKKGNSFFQLLDLFEEDKNYIKIHEFGIGLNHYSGFPLKDNFLPNEMIEGIHLGLGLTPYTEFHLDLVCPNIDVFTINGSVKKNLVLSHKRDRNTTGILAHP